MLVANRLRDAASASHVDSAILDAKMNVQHLRSLPDRKHLFVSLDDIPDVHLLPLTWASFGYAVWWCLDHTAMLWPMHTSMCTAQPPIELHRVLALQHTVLLPDDGSQAWMMEVRAKYASLCDQRIDFHTRSISLSTMATMQRELAPVVAEDSSSNLAQLSPTSDALSPSHESHESHELPTIENHACVLEAQSQLRALDAPLPVFARSRWAFLPSLAHAMAAYNMEMVPRDMDTHAADFVLDECSSLTLCSFQSDDGDLTAYLRSFQQRCVVNAAQFQHNYIVIDWQLDDDGGHSEFVDLLLPLMPSFIATMHVLDHHVLHIGLIHQLAPVLAHLTVSGASSLDRSWVQRSCSVNERFLCAFAAINCFSAQWILHRVTLTDIARYALSGKSWDVLCDTLDRIPAPVVINLLQVLSGVQGDHKHDGHLGPSLDTDRDEDEDEDEDEGGNDLHPNATPNDSRSRSTSNSQLISSARSLHHDVSEPPPSMRSMENLLARFEASGPGSHFADASAGASSSSSSSSSSSTITEEPKSTVKYPKTHGFKPDPRQIGFERAGSSSQTRLVWRQRT